MPIPASVLYPPFNIVRLSHIVLTVTDLKASRGFYFDTLGLQVTDETGEAIYLRAMEERGHHCVVLERGDHALAKTLSFKVFSEGDLDKARAYFDEQGIENGWVERPYQGRTLRAVDPLGMPIEFYFSMDKLKPITSSTNSIAV